MNFLKRAGKSIVARKGKTLIMLIILTVIGSLVLSGFAIQNAAKAAGEEARKELGATVTLQVDRQKQMQERQASGERGRPEDVTIDIKEAEAIEQLDEVKTVNYLSQATATASDIEPIESESTDSGGGRGGEMPEGMTVPDFSLNGVTNMELLDSFTDGTLNIVDGEALTADSKNNSVVIDENLATENDLKLGDTFKLKSTTTEKSKTLTIIGLSASTEATSDANFRAAGFLDPMNQMYIANDTLASFATEDGTVSASSVVYSLKDPSEIEAFKKEATTVSSLDWETFTLDANDAAYQKMVGPIEQVAAFSKSVVYLVSIAGGLILALLILLSVRERRKEMGILLAMGEKRPKLMGQLLVETFAIAAVAFLVTYATGGMTSQFMTDQLLNREVTEAASSVATTGFGGPGGRGQQVLDSIPQITEMTTKIDGAALIQVIEIGSLIVFLSVLLPSLALLRMNPKEILLRED
ncbi:ABC transporter permease [Exiguobacterium sp. s193]|uniref:ABC transporter permease n=1 Tax=Exiguobacterium sp. s193 TaxID=2751207 RepID=UPI001BE72BF7|nr:ABC transporter permease [Exiguobacterium sp. s193]